MNRNPTSKLLLLLAMSSLSKREIIEAINEIALMSNRELDEMLTTTRKLYPEVSSNIFHSYINIDNEYDTNKYKLERPSTSTKKPRQTTDIAYEIDRLLRKEAGLSATVAAEWLTIEIRKEMGGILIPKIGKGAFISWVERISKKTPPSLLLHIATKIRNAYVHGKDKDWPLL